jgi:hypothetical protein
MMDDVLLDQRGHLEGLDEFRVLCPTELILQVLRQERNRRNGIRGKNPRFFFTRKTPSASEARLLHTLMAARGK